jgi:hypothetical protein
VPQREAITVGPIMQAVVRFAILAIGFALSSCASAYETDALISLRQDASGLGARTWELMLKTSGAIVEETYDISAKDGDHIESSRIIRRVPTEQSRELAARAAQLIEGLPKTVDDRIVVDPETRAIRIQSGGQKLFVGWSLYESTPPSNQTRAFTHAWEAIRTMLAGADRSSFDGARKAPEAAPPKSGSDDEMKTKDEWYALRNALFEQDDEKAARLLKAEPGLISARSGLGETVLHYLAVENWQPGVEWLWKHGASLDTKNVFGTPVLFEVAQLEYRDLFRWFVQNGADAFARDQDGQDLIEYLREFEKDEMIRFVVETVPKLAQLEAPENERSH